MQYRNRLPADFLAAAAPKDAMESARPEAGAMRDILAEAHTRDTVAALLYLLTLLANCGLDPGAPPLLRSAHTEV